MPETIIETIVVKRYDATGDSVGWDFIDIDVSILVNGYPLDRDAA